MFSERTFKFFFIAIFSIVVIAFVLNIVVGVKMYTSRGTMYLIEVPTYGGRVESYYTNEYRIDPETRCVKFVDGFRFERTLCNNYNVTKLK